MTDPNIDNYNPAGVKNASLKTRLSYFSLIYWEKFGKFFGVNLMFSILSILLLPAGLAAAGITNVTRNIFSGKHSFGVSDFFDTIKENWRQALAAGIINLIIGFMLIVDGYFFYMAMPSGILFAAGFALVVLLAVVFLFMNFYIWPLIITVNMPLKQIYNNSLRLAFIGIRDNLICLLLNVLLIGILLSLLFFAQEWFILVAVVELLLGAMLLPSFQSLLVQCFAFPVITEYIIEPYYKQHPEEDQTIIHELGIYLSDDE